MDINKYEELQKRNNLQMQRLKELNAYIEGMKETSQIVDPPVYMQKTPLGILKYVYKRLVRKSISWFTRPYWAQQNLYNMQLVNCLHDILKSNEEIMFQLNCISGNGEFFENNQMNILKNNEPKVVQVVSSLNFGDAVGNDVMAIKRALTEEGILTGIYAANIHPKIPFGMAHPYSELPELTENDIVIYHFASEDPLAEQVKNLPCKKVLRYHNVTPPEFFRPYNQDATVNTTRGLKQVKELAGFMDYAMVASDFNKHDLLDMGYTCDMDVVPCLIPFKDYEQTPDASVIETYKDGWTNIVFVGRIAPNKKFEDIIDAFAVYKEKYNPKSRLLLVGSYGENDLYYLKLKKQVEKKKIEDVIFTGHISFAAILAYYKVADVFLCMSEHEGFCVPLVEAMYFEKPIIAYKSTAIPYTLGDAGMLLESKEPTYVASKIYELVQSESMQEEYISNAKRRLQDFQYNVVKEKIITCIKKYKN